MFTCELTTEGILLSWKETLLTGQGVRFLLGEDEDSLAQAFVSLASSGSQLVTLPFEADSLPNAVGVLQVRYGSDTVREHAPLPLIEGLAYRDIVLLFKLAHDHARACMLRGQTARLYRQRTSGTPCAYCTDPVTGARLSQDCQYCHGSGYELSWLGPFETNVLFLQHSQDQVVPASPGVAQNAMTDVLQLTALPRPRANDRLFLPGTSRVYVVGSPAETVAGVSGVPAVVRCPARLLDPDEDDAAIPDQWLS